MAHGRSPLLTRQAFLLTTSAPVPWARVGIKLTVAVLRSSDNVLTLESRVWHKNLNIAIMGGLNADVLEPNVVVTTDQTAVRRMDIEGHSKALDMLVLLPPVQLNGDH